MSVFSETILAVLLVAGGVFTFIGSLALVRFKDFYTRLHGPTKATTLGVGCLLLASALFFSVHSEGFSLHEVLVSLFLFITAPSSASRPVSHAASNPLDCLLKYFPEDVPA